MSGQLGTIPYPQWQDDSGGVGSPQSGPLSLNVTQSDPVPTTWAPSPWQPGMPPTARSVNTSQYPMPTQDQIEAQRQAIYGRLRQYGYPPQQLSDQQVLGTMSNLPQQPVQYPPWAEDWMRRNPQAVSGARPGIDMPSNQTYEDYNLRARALGGSPTQIGYSNAIPRGALIEHYGQPWMDEQDKQWMVEHSTPGATLRLVDPTHPQGYDVHVPGQLPSWMINPQAPGAPWSRPATGAAPQTAAPATQGAQGAQGATPQQPQQQAAADPYAMFKAGMRAPPAPVHLADASTPQLPPLFADHDATAARYRAMLSA